MTACVVCRRKAEVEHYGEPLCGECADYVQAQVQQRLDKDAMYMRLAFGEPELGEIQNGIWSVTGERAARALRAMRQ